MAKIARKLTDLVGNTPLMELSGYSGKYGLEQNIIAKLEAFNPAGSVKDRVALSMIEDAEVRHNTVADVAEMPVVVKKILGIQ